MARIPKRTPSTGGMQPIDPRLLYPLDVFMKHSGLGAAALRKARRNGLRILRTGGRAFVLGSEFQRYLEELKE